MPCRPTSSPRPIGKPGGRTLELDLGRHLKTGYHGKLWTAQDLELLGTLPDAEVARRLGKTVRAVRVMRTRRGIVTVRDGRKRG